FARYTDVITRWALEGKDAPLEIPTPRKRGVERPFGRILNLVEAFPISKREIERIQFEFRRFGLEIPDPIKNTQNLFGQTFNDVNEAAKLIQDDLLPILDQPCLSDENYYKIMELLDQIREKNPLWKIPLLSHPSFFGKGVRPLVIVESKEASDPPIPR